MKTIILISGYKRSGKDETAKLFKSYLEDKKIPVDIMSFADDMKDVLCETYKLNREELDDFKNEEVLCEFMKYNASAKEIIYKGGVTFREILQNFGQGMKKIFGKHVWSDRIYEKIKKSEAEVILIPDLRLRDEVNRLLEKCYYEDCKIITVRISRVGQINTDTHITENDLDDCIFSYNLINYGTSLVQLDSEVRTVCRGEGL